MNATTIHPKAGAGALGGAVTILAVYLLSLAHVTLPDEVTQALPVIVGFVTAYLTPSPITISTPTLVAVSGSGVNAATTNPTIQTPTGGPP